jgi:hypothetical protein
MKTIQEIKDEVAQGVNRENWAELIDSLGYDTNLHFIIDEYIDIAMEKYAEQFKQ